MLKIRYSLQEPFLLSGWSDVEAEFDQLQPRSGETVVVLNIAKLEPSDDYEWWCYDGVSLVRSGKSEPVLPLRFESSNPAHDPPTRIEHIEEFLRKVYP